MPPYAHSHPDHPNDPSHWEPIFTPHCPTLTGHHCPACHALLPDHGHLNKVAQPQALRSDRSALAWFSERLSASTTETLTST